MPTLPDTVDGEAVVYEKTGVPLLETRMTPVSENTSTVRLQLPYEVEAHPTDVEP